MLMTKISWVGVVLLYTMCMLSEAHEGFSLSPTPVVNWISSPDSTSESQICLTPFTLELNAIHLPLGDQLGEELLVVFWDSGLGSGVFRVSSTSMM